MYNLTPNQKELLVFLVREIRAGNMPEDFTFIWGNEGTFLHHALNKGPGFLQVEGVTQSALDALAKNDLLHIQTSEDGFGIRHCSITGKGYEAVDSNFSEPDTSFVRHLTPLADIGHFDEEIKSRCLPILGAGPADPRLWDSAVRTAGVILEERLRDVGQIADPHIIGRDLVNRIFGKNGSLASKFTHDGEREGYRDLYSGIVGAFRNPSAHHLIDPKMGSTYIPVESHNSFSLLVLISWLF